MRALRLARQASISISLRPKPVKPVGNPNAEAIYVGIVSDTVSAKQRATPTTFDTGSPLFRRKKVHRKYTKSQWNKCSMSSSSPCHAIHETWRQAVSLSDSYAGGRGIRLNPPGANRVDFEVPANWHRTNKSLLSVPVTVDGLTNRPSGVVGQKNETQSEWRQISRGRSLPKH